MPCSALEFVISLPVQLLAKRRSPPLKIHCKLNLGAYPVSNWRSRVRVLIGRLYELSAGATAKLPQNCIGAVLHTHTKRRQARTL